MMSYPIKSPAGVSHDKILKDSSSPSIQAFSMNEKLSEFCQETEGSEQGSG